MMEDTAIIQTKTSVFCSYILELEENVSPNDDRPNISITTREYVKYSIS